MGTSLALAILFALAMLTPMRIGNKALAQDEAKRKTVQSDTAQIVQNAVDFDHALDGYVPKKDHYNV